MGRRKLTDRIVESLYSLTKFMNKSQKQKIREEFDMFWGYAPKGTLKYKRGKEIEDYLIQKLEEREREIVEKVKKLLDKDRCDPDCGCDISHVVVEDFINSLKQDENKR